MDQRSAVDLVFQAVDRPAGRVAEPSAELAEADVSAVLESPPGLTALPVSASARKQKKQAQVAPLLPPECQGAACHARAALSSFAAACAANRKCSEIFSGQVKGKETHVGQVAHQSPTQ